MEKTLSAVASLCPEINSSNILAPMYVCKSEEEFLGVLPGILDAAASHLVSDQGHLLVEDAHLLLESPGSLHLLHLLYERLSPFLPMLITTRAFLTDSKGALFQITETLPINNATLAFGLDEILELYRRVYGIKLDLAQAQWLLEKTAGWPTGLSLLRGRLAEFTGDEHLAPGPELDQYFISQCLGILSPYQAENLVRVAQLESIPKAMLTDFGLAESIQALDTLFEKGLFVNRLERLGQQSYRLHHLLRDCLRNFVDQSIGRSDASSFCVRAGNWHLKRGQLDEALALLGRSHDWEALKSVLTQYAPELMSINKLFLVTQALADCPKETIEREPLFEALLGHAYFNDRPDVALNSFEHAWKNSRLKNDRISQLIAGAGIIISQLSNQWNLRKISEVVKENSAIFDKMLDAGELHPALAGTCAYLLSLSICYSTANYDLANLYAKRAEEIFLRMGTKDIPPEVFMARVYTAGIRGHMKEALLYMQKIYLLLRSPYISISVKSASNIFYANFSIMRGKVRDYRSLYDDFRKLFPMLVDYASVAAYFHIWDLDPLLANSEFDQVVERAKTALAIPFCASAPHIASQCYQYIALAHAHQGHRQEALEAIKTAMNLRAKVGGTFFILLNRVVAGGVYALLGELRAAERMLSGAIRHLDRIGDFHTIAIAYAYLAYLYSLQGRIDEALEAITSMLATLGGRTHVISSIGKPA